MIALFSFLLAVIVAGVGAFVLNMILVQQYGFIITILSFGIRQIALVLGVSAFVAFIANFLPSYSGRQGKNP